MISVGEISLALIFLLEITVFVYVAQTLRDKELLGVMEVDNFRR